MDDTTSTSAAGMKFLKSSRSRSARKKFPQKLRYLSLLTSSGGNSSSRSLLSSSSSSSSTSCISSTSTTSSSNESHIKKQNKNQPEKVNIPQIIQDNHSNTSKDSSYIDDLFSTVKKKSNIDIDNKKIIKSSDTMNRKGSKPSTNIESTYGIIKSANVQIISPEAPLERIDKATGLPVYKAHILKVGEGGGTPLCPFDCDCCF